MQGGSWLTVNVRGDSPVSILKLRSLAVNSSCVISAATSKIAASEPTVAAETCCSTLDEAMRQVHPSCLQSHLRSDTSAGVFDGYMVWLHADCRNSSVSCTDCLRVCAMSQVWQQYRSGPWAWRRDLEALIRARCSSCIEYLFSTVDRREQRDFLRLAAHTAVREGNVLVAEMFKMVVQNSERHLYLEYHVLREVFQAAAYAHLIPASKQQSATVSDRQFDCVADLITQLLAASADLIVVLAAALGSMLEVSCADGIRWLRQQYCTAENTEAVVDRALQHLCAHDRYRNLDVAPLSTASLQALLEAGEADRALNLYSMWWRTKDEWLARRGPVEHHAQCCESARVIMDAAGSSAEALLVGVSGDGLLCDALHSSNAQQLAALLSNSALTQDVLVAKCSEEASALHYAVVLCCDSSVSAGRTCGSTRACIEVLVKAAHDANCLHAVISAQDAAGITAASWLLRIGYSAFAALLPSGSSLKVSAVHELCCYTHHQDILRCNTTIPP
jgi:hypothetical protein